MSESAAKTASPAFPDEARKFLELVFGAENVLEVRSPRHNQYGQTASGYFNDVTELVQSASKFDGKANIYLTMNPVKAMLAAYDSM